MNLKDHKRLVYEYEELLRELRALRSVKPDAEWYMSVDGGCNILVSADYAQKMLRERTCAVEKEAKDTAATLGVTFEERA